MRALDIAVVILLVIGGLNWGLVGLMDFNLFSVLFGNMSIISRLIYALMGISAIYQAFQWNAVKSRWS